MAKPAAAAVRSSPPIIARAIPRRRCVAATVTALMDHSGATRPGEVVSSEAHESIVPTGTAGTPGTGVLELPKANGNTGGTGAGSVSSPAPVGPGSATRTGPGN